MHALDALGDPVRRRISALLVAGFATVRPQGARRPYAVDAAPLHEVDDCLEPLRRSRNTRPDALGTELARGRRQARLNPPAREK